MNAGDSELLARYLDRNDEAAFARLVEVYGGLVFGAARRVTGESEAARDAAQNTFLALARKAASLRGRNSLGGWLHHTAMLTARNLVRARQREERKRVALGKSMETTHHSSAEACWAALRPVLDDSLASLSEKDRDAVVLRFYRGCSVQEVASAMKVTLAAAQKRLGRALEKLRSQMQRRGVTLSVPALGSGLGLWMADSQSALALTTAWASTATSTAAAGSIGSSWTLTTILTAMTKSKLTTAIIAAALLFAGGAIALHKAKDRDHRSSRSAAARGAASPSAKSARPATTNDTARHLHELEAKFGPERTRQARRIVNLIQAGFQAEGESALVGLDAMTAKWLGDAKAQWNLDKTQFLKMSEVVGREQDKRVAAFKQAVHRMGIERTATYVEAVLLADQVTKGELARGEFEEAVYRLSKMESAEQLELSMGSLLSLDLYLIQEEVASAVEEILPPDRHQEFREQVEEVINQIFTSPMAVVKRLVPDLSEQQEERIIAYYRELGSVCYPRRSMFEEFLSEAQYTAWQALDQEREAQRSRATTRLHTVGPRGNGLVMDSPLMRQPVDGAPAVYPWEEPMSLDDAEKEARKMSEGGLYSEETERVITEKTEVIMEAERK